MFPLPLLAVLDQISASASSSNSNSNTNSTTFSEILGKLLAQPLCLANNRIHNSSAAFENHQQAHLATISISLLHSLYALLSYETLYNALYFISTDSITFLSSPSR
ncbi:hypothetical protein BB560_004351 [Smittium megazygosporum]|uniref:Uncharacterized protein n=1 Tax=Smittium megazygosporum TaxID=133381 RepID=A0A2T9Z9J3_9FUNG|nr:hypothetical protein BB560_004351 [Smittium megazygosporum]